MSEPDRLQKAWATRRAHIALCAWCLQPTKCLYSVPNIHEDRDLCIDCAWSIIMPSDANDSAAADPEEGK